MLVCHRPDAYRLEPAFLGNGGLSRGEYGCCAENKTKQRTQRAEDASDPHVGFFLPKGCPVVTMFIAAVGVVARNTVFKKWHVGLMKQGRLILHIETGRRGCSSYAPGVLSKSESRRLGRGTLCIRTTRSGPSMKKGAVLILASRTSL